jgi:hypothetical protein
LGLSASNKFQLQFGLSITSPEQAIAQIFTVLFISIPQPFSFYNSISNDYQNYSYNRCAPKLMKEINSNFSQMCITGEEQMEEGHSLINSSL